MRTIVPDRSSGSIRSPWTRSYRPIPSSSLAWLTAVTAVFGSSLIPATQVVGICVVRSAVAGNIASGVPINVAPRTTERRQER